MKLRNLIVLTASCCLCASFAGTGEVKLVSVGSHLPLLGKLKSDIARYEAAAPFDGVTFYIGVSSDVFRPQAFTEAQREEMRREAEIYRGIAFAKWKYNFLRKSTLMSRI